MWIQHIWISHTPLLSSADNSRTNSSSKRRVLRLFVSWLCFSKLDKRVNAINVPGLQLPLLLIVHGQFQEFESDETDALVLFVHSSGLLSAVLKSFSSSPIQRVPVLLFQSSGLQILLHYRERDNR